MRGKFLSIIVAIMAFAMLITACNDGNRQGNELQEYKVTVSSETDWNEAEKVVFYDLNGNSVATAEIVSGKASVKLEAGNYIVQVSDVPDSVSYKLPLLTAKNRSAAIKLNKSANNVDGYNIYNVLGVVLLNGTPANNYLVTMCLEPLFCLEPIYSDQNGTVNFETYSGRYHVSINPKGSETIFEDYYNITSGKRFFISEIGKANENNPSGNDPSGNDPSENDPGENDPGSNSPEHSHTYSYKVTTPATCEADGEEEGTCEICGDKKTRKIDMLGHDWKELGKFNAATCTEAGFSENAKCNRCGKTRQNVTVPALGHDLKETSTTATCTQDGISKVECTRCDFSKEEVTDALGHDWDPQRKFYVKDATCQTTGKIHIYCKRCNVREEQILDKVDHQYTRERFNPKPTCTQSGKVIKYCRWCETALPEEEAPATGHDWYENEIISQPTCTTQGKSKHTCKTCNTVETYDTPALGHIFGDYVVDKAATDSTEGSKSRHCIFENCTQTTGTSTIPKLSDNKEKVTYEFNIRRNNKFEYKLPTGGLQFEICDSGDKVLETINVTEMTFSKEVSKDAAKLKVKGLQQGYKSKLNEYELKPESPVVTITLEASVITTNRVMTDDNKEIETKPETIIDDGDVMFDFKVWNSKNKGHHEKDQWFSEMIKGKKLVFLDFFWMGCGPCKYLMGQFNYVYQKYLQPYKDDILVLMVDVMEDETNEDALESFRTQNNYSDDYIICQGKPDNARVDILHWFQLEGHKIGVPGHIWIDGEGVVNRIGNVGGSETEFEKQFNDYILGFLDLYDIPQEFDIPETDKVQSDKTTSSISIISEMEKPFVYDKKYY